MNVKSNAVGKSIADRLAVICLDFRQWTGSVAFDKEDWNVGSDGKAPPPEVIAALGQKRIIDPEDLKIFNTIKQRAVRLLESRGVPWLGSMAIPIGIADEVCGELQKLKDEYNARRDQFVANYDRKLASWILANPEFAEEIRHAAKKKEDVERKIHANFNVFKIQRLNEEDLNEAGLGDTLLNEITKTAGQFFKESLANKDEVTAKSLNTILKMRERLYGLSFLDGAIAPVCSEIDRTISSLSKKGPYKGEALTKIKNIALTLCSVDRMRDLSKNQSTEEFKLQETLEVHELTNLMDAMDGKAATDSEPKPIKKIIPIQTQPTPTTEEEPIESGELFDFDGDEFDKWLNEKEATKLQSEVKAEEVTLEPEPKSEIEEVQKDVIEKQEVVEEPTEDPMPTVVKEQRVAKVDLYEEVFYERSEDDECLEDAEFFDEVYDVPMVGSVEEAARSFGMF